MALLYQLARGLAYLHSKNILHRDLKPQNILLSGDVPKIADFGFAIKSEHQFQDKFTIGSPLYMGPEALTHRIYSTKNDIWALGVVMFEVLEGKAPWEAASPKDLPSVRGEVNFGVLEVPEVKQLIENCLNKDKEKRPTAEEVMGVLGAFVAKESGVSTA